MNNTEFTRAEANKVQLAKNCRFGTISDGCHGVWSSGRTEQSAIRNARKYFLANKHDFLALNQETNEYEFNLESLMDSVQIIEVV